MKKFKIGFAFGGGGVRGFAHLGIISVLEKNGIYPDAIAGTSMGALMGALYAYFMDSTQVRIEVERFFKSKIPGQIMEITSKLLKEKPFGRLLSNAMQFFLINRTAQKTSVFTESQIEKFYSYIPVPQNFSELKIPFCAVATDIENATVKCFWDGNLRRAVLASSSVQGYFPPVKIDETLLIDGGIIMSVPVSPLKERCDFVIAFDVRSNEKKQKEFKNGVEILKRADEIASHRLSDIEVQKADFVLRPDVGDINWSDFNKWEFCIEKGRQIALLKLEELKKKIKHKKAKTFLKRLL